jgi:hypothetical protein
MTKNVHTEHCCAVHGCKYGDPDCPVETKVQKQSYACEGCDDAASRVRQLDEQTISYFVAKGSDLILETYKVACTKVV